MVKSVTRTQMNRLPKQSDGTDRHVCEWRLVDHFNTVEEAERVLGELRHRGVESEVSLIDGLSVIARRIRPCDSAR